MKISIPVPELVGVESFRDEIVDWIQDHDISARFYHGEYTAGRPYINNLIFKVDPDDVMMFCLRWNVVIPHRPKNRKKTES